METIEVDVAVVGAGTAGLNAWKGASSAGAKTVLIDPGPLGTTCARVGCMPSKLLIAAAEIAHDASRASEFGVRIPTIEVDPVAVMERLRRMRDLFVNKTKKGIEAIQKRGGLLDARARIASAHTLELSDGRRVQAKQIVLATGSRPWIPPAYRDLGDRLLTNDEVFELPRIPESLLVVGAGAIGVELGQAFHRLGARVTVLELGDRIAGIEDEKVAAAARKIFKSEIEMHLHHELHSVKSVGGEVEICFIGDDGVEDEQQFEYVLIATGRRPALSSLGLANAGLDPLPPINPRTMQIGDSHFFVAGDVSGDRMILHEGAHDGRVAGRNAARYPEIEEAPRLTPLAIVFSDPQIATVGMRASEYDESKHIVGELDFRFQSRAKVIARDAGLMRVYADKKDGKLLGATILGPEAEHLGHTLAWAVQQGLDAADVLELPFYHPVLEEGLQGLLRDIVTQASG